MVSAFPVLSEAMRSMISRFPCSRSRFSSSSSWRAAWRRSFARSFSAAWEAACDAVSWAESWALWEIEGAFWRAYVVRACSVVVRLVLWRRLKVSVSTSSR